MWWGGPRTRGGPIGLRRGGPRTRGGPIGLQMGGSSTRGGPTGLQRGGPITRTEGRGHVQGTVHTVRLYGSFQSTPSQGNASISNILKCCIISGTSPNTVYTYNICSTIWIFSTFTRTTGVQYCMDIRNYKKM
jgi:hypothetical protein